jgi:hypothetical protein
MLLIVVLLAATCFTAFAHPEGKRVYKAKRINPHPPALDGKLDDAIWQKTGWEGNFIQREPYEGKEPSQKTEFKIMYDDKNLYVAIKAYDTEPDKIVKRMARRDNLDGDWVGVTIDSYHDLRTAFSFRVNAAGVKGDEAITEDGDNSDDSWDPIWYVSTYINEEGWTAEMKIPFSQLRFAKKDNHVWGLQCSRKLFRKQEQSHWQFIPKDSPGWVHRFGEIHGIHSIKSGRRIELTPYTVGNVQRFPGEDENPFSTGKSHGFTGGLDGKIAVTSDLTLDFTINPDFGQVEADPSEVNLTTTESYFEEKRPFFIEGRNILNFRLMGGDGSFSSDNLFYSRRIGRTPHHYPDTNDDEYVDMPANTSILGAFKLTGKTRNGLSIGIMESITSSEYAEIDFLGERRNETVEPLTNYFMMRLQKDYRGGDTIIGGMVTATNRGLKDSDPQLNFLHKAAYTGGFDFFHTWKKKTYYFSLKTVFSHVSGDKEAILETQQSPLRYYQRPDAPHVEVDPERTSLSGHGGTINFGKGGKGHLRYSMGVTWRSPGLELNDIGYLRYADRIMQWVWAGYRIWKPFSVFKEISFNFNQWQGWDFSGENIFNGGNIGVYTKFKNYWSVSTGINPQGGSVSTTALRGGPALKWPGGWSHWIYVNSDSRKAFRFGVGTGGYVSNDNAGRSRRYDCSVTYRPSSALSLSLSPFIRLNKSILQYVDTAELETGNRYIFGSIDQKTVGVTIRLNYSITPDLSIQFYGQPFISTGKYTDYKQITDPRADVLEDRYRLYAADEIQYAADDDVYYVTESVNGNGSYSFDNPNFNFLQFRSNLVVRWEYSPGSTVYLVWSQGRTDYYSINSTDDFTFGNNMRDLFSIQPHNVFLVKFTYRFNL